MRFVAVTDIVRKTVDGCWFLEVAVDMARYEAPEFWAAVIVREAVDDGWFLGI